MNTARLKAKMVLNGETNLILAKGLGITPQRLSAKLNARKGAEFTQSEIMTIKTRYHLAPEEVDEIFLN